MAVLPFISVSTLRTPHATCVFMSHRVSLVKASPLQFRALQYFYSSTLGTTSQRPHLPTCCDYGHPLIYIVTMQPSYGEHLKCFTYVPLIGNTRYAPHLTLMLHGLGTKQM